jgi:hypothetical protein
MFAVQPVGRWDIVPAAILFSTASGTWVVSSTWLPGVAGAAPSHAAAAAGVLKTAAAAAAAVPPLQLIKHKLPNDVVALDNIACRNHATFCGRLRWQLMDTSDTDEPELRLETMYFHGWQGRGLMQVGVVTITRPCQPDSWRVRCTGTCNKQQHSSRKKASRDTRPLHA